MAPIWLLVGLVFFFQNGFLSSGISTNISMKPSEVQIGGIFTFNSSIGKVAKVAIEAAIEDVNSDPSVLGGTELKLVTKDVNDSGFLGIIEGNFFNN